MPEAAEERRKNGSKDPPLQGARLNPAAAEVYPEVDAGLVLVGGLPQRREKPLG